MQSLKAACAKRAKVIPDSPGGGGAHPDEQRSEDLSQRVRVQAVVRLGLGHLGQVCEQVLQGEAVVEGNAGGTLQSQAHLPAAATGYSAICGRRR